MDVAIEIHNIPVATVQLKDRIDAFNSPILREKLDQLVKQDVTRIVLDLSAVKFLDSAGMAVLVSVLKQVRQKGGNARMILPLEEGAKRILHLTRFDRVFDLDENIEAALLNF
jgi:anti-anti-sigma factor